MTETPLTLILHFGTFGCVISILGIVLRQHKVWTRMKDRVNQLWYAHCKVSGDKFDRVENGH